MKGYILLLLSATLLLFATSCGTTRLIASDSNTSIYVNNVLAGKGIAEVKRTGFPKRMFVETRRSGASTGETIVKRKFTALTFFAGMYSYGLALLFTFQYPSLVYLPENKEDYGKLWERPYEGSAWERPPSRR